MKKTLCRPLALLCLLAFLAACSDSGDDSKPTPTARATAAAETLPTGSNVQLDGSDSHSPDGGNLSYQWTLVDRPEFSRALISDPALVNPSFTADLPGQYTAELRVSSNGRISQPSRVSISATSSVPVAIAATPMNRLLNSWVQLDGSHSHPPTGGDPARLSYDWAFSPPSGTDALDNPDTATPGFSPTMEGIYRATLVVSYEGQSSEPFDVQINVSRTNTVPVADAGGPYTLVLGETVTLDGSGSSDADGDALNYRWVLPNNTHPQPRDQDNKPRGSSAQLPNTDSVTIDFTPDAVGTYRINLQVFDGTALSEASTASVTVARPANHPNTPPVAVIYDHAPKGTGSSVGEVEISLWGYATFYSGSYDQDGDALTYKWEWVEVPEAFKATRHYTQEWLNTRTTTVPFLAATRNESTGAYVPIEGHYTLRLTVNDGTLDSPSVEQTLHVRTGANTRPVPVAKAEIPALLVGTEAWFDGSESSDPQDGTLGLQYQWSWVYKPPGSNAAFTTPTAARTSFTPDRPGPYIAELIVTDDDGASSKPAHGNYEPVTASINARRTNNPPFARFTGVSFANDFENNESTSRTQGIEYDEIRGIYTYQLGSIYERCQNANPEVLNYHCVDNFAITTAGYDADGDQVFYDITLTQPQGSRFQGSYTGAYTSFMSGRVNIGQRGSEEPEGITRPGDYTFTLQASDGSSLSDPQTLTVQVLDYPTDYKVLKVGYLYNGLWFEKGSAHGQDLLNSHFLPFNLRDAADYHPFANQGGILQYLKLTAEGQDYTTQNIQTRITRLVNGSYVDFDDANAFQPEIRDLPEVIHAGETQVFNLWVPRMPAPAADPETYLLEWSFESPEASSDEREGSFKASISINVSAQ